ncbi:MAG: uracil-DNA glycosylase [Planctomycetaceae bacterium]|nr:uracil-DNA glycosylase [Planctomycetaceae bacterium]
METNALPECWKDALCDEFARDSFLRLQQFVDAERRQYQVFPAEKDVFNALQFTPLSTLKVVILGQDPYHDDGQAHGLSFSVQRNVPLPPSLRNIYRELQDDLGIEPAGHGCLQSWAEQGVLLLNTVLTVRAHEAFSHRKKGWEQLTDRIIQCANECPNVAFVLWGKPAQQKKSLIASHHLIIESAHPSPLSARRGFFGSKPFSQINAYLIKSGLASIDWNVR